MTLQQQLEEFVLKVWVCHFDNEYCDVHHYAESLHEHWGVS